MNRKIDLNLVLANLRRHIYFFSNIHISKQKSLSFKAKFYILFVFTFLSNINCFSQELSVNDAIIYLENIVNSDLSKQDNIYNGIRKVAFNIYENEISIKYIWENNKDVIKYEYLDSDINYNEITFNISNISEIFTNKYKTKKTVSLRCTNNSKNCFLMENEALKINFSKSFSDRPTAYNHYDFIHLFYLKNKLNQEKVFIALNYILYEKNKINNKEQDLTLNQILNNSNSKSETVDLIRQNEVSYLNIDIGGINTNVILDSGASDVSISKNFEQKLLDNGIIKSKDYLTPGLYTIADGSIVESNRFIAPYIKINNTVIKNVRCSVNKSKDLILLGKSFLDRFKSWQINNESKKLILKI